MIASGGEDRTDRRLSPLDSSSTDDTLVTGTKGTHFTDSTLIHTSIDIVAHSTDDTIVTSTLV